MAGTGLRNMLWAGAAATALAACGTGTSGNTVQNGQAPVPTPAAPQAPSSGQLRVSFENGECRLAWNGRPVNGQGLLDAGVADLEGVIQRAGGPSAATVELLTATVASNAETPWRCVGGAVHQLRRVGYARLALRIEGGGAPAGAIVIDLPIATDAPPPPVEPATNRVAVANDGALRWNGASVEPEALRNYLVATQRMVPLPRLELEIDGQASFATALGVLNAVRRAGVPTGPGAVEAPPPEEPIAPPGFDTPPSVVAEVPPPGDGFELIGLERFVPALR